ncbi:MAG: long-chain fatty acid--CoA ligase [Aliidongia sp.]
MTATDWANIPAMFFDWAARRGDRPFLWAKAGSAWSPISWREAAQRVRLLARGLRSLGVGTGDRVAIVAENRPEWVIADLAIMAAGAVTVPAYTTYTVEDYRHVLANSNAKALILSSNLLGQRVLPAADQLTYLTSIVALEPLKVQSDAHVYGWDEILAAGAEAPDEIDALVGAMQPDDVACLVYTSGTGGVPKGVMLSHRNMMANARGAKLVLENDFGPGGDEVFLSFLPLTHSYEHSAGMIYPLLLGAEIYFSAPENLAGDLPVVRPTIMTAVPRLLETLQRRILQATERAGGTKLTLFRLALRLGTKRYEHPGSLTVLERLQDALVEQLVRRKVRQRFGGRLKAFVSGGAPLNRDVALFFLALGANVLQGYGQTEAAPVISVNLPRKIKVDTVGPPLDGVEVKVAADGELLVRGPNVMLGYWNDPESTARAIRDGWLHTGDIGQIDADGYLMITDRKRDFIKNSGGEMISPARIEGFLTLQEGIGQAMAYGDRKPYVVALIVPSDELIAKFADARDGAGEPVPASRHPGVQRTVAAAIANVNRDLTPVERIRRYVLIDEAFTVANGRMTPTLKIKRHMIRQAYGPLLESLYESKMAGGNGMRVAPRGECKGDPGPTRWTGPGTGAQDRDPTPPSEMP